MEYSRHQSTKASKPPNQKYLPLVEVPRTESVVVEGVCAFLLPVVAVRVVEGPEIRLKSAIHLSEMYPRPEPEGLKIPVT